MSHVTTRIASNVVEHGVLFAVSTEVARFKRAGFSHEAAVSAGCIAVRAAITHAGLRK